MAIEDVRRRARADLHEAMSRRANYYEAANSIPTPVTVRITRVYKTAGDLKGTNFNYAEQEAVAPVAVFWRDECCPKNKSYLILETGEAYFIGVTRAPHGQTIEAEIADMLPDMIKKLGLEPPR